MQVQIGLGKTDQGTEQIAALLHEPLRKFGEALSKDYGGGIEHLWIDLEFSPVESDFHAPYGFRFQKRVSVKPISGLPALVRSNVGHYSVRPDFFALARVPLEDVVPYIGAVLYESTAVLEKRHKALVGFDVSRFRQDFLALVSG